MKIYLLKTKSGTKYYTSFQNAINNVMENVQHSVMFHDGKIIEQEINLANESLHILLDEEWMYIQGKRCKEVYKIETIETED